MQDESPNHAYVIELIAKALDEPLSAPEQRAVDEAMQNSLAIRVAADGLREFDGLLKRTGMAIPAEGFPARVLARLEAYEKRRTRAQWLLTLGVVFLGSLAALVWLALNWGAVVSASILVVTSAFVLLPLALLFLFAFLQLLGQGPLIFFALCVLLLTVVWARVSGGLTPSPARH